MVDPNLSLANAIQETRRWIRTTEFRSLVGVFFYSIYTENTHMCVCVYTTFIDSPADRCATSCNGANQQVKMRIECIAQCGCLCSFPVSRFSLPLALPLLFLFAVSSMHSVITLLKPKTYCQCVAMRCCCVDWLHMQHHRVAVAASVAGAVAEAAAAAARGNYVRN